MSDDLPPSEFGGKIQKNGVQPLPHVPDAKEQLSLIYRTGDASGQTILSKKDEGVYFAGLLPFEEQRQIREDEGAFEVGQYDPMKDL